MTMFLEVFMYLVIAFGIMVVTMTIFGREMNIDEKYLRIKRDNANVKVIVEIKGFSEQDSNRISWIIQKGSYEDIYDVVNDYEIKNLDKDK